jgi:hypothetical protein
MTALVLSRAEYLVVLDILHVSRVLGLEAHLQIPADRETHLELIHQGIRLLETRGLVKIEGGRHIIERRLLEVVSVVARPKAVVTTIRDRAGIGAQLYLHYQAHCDVVEQMLPDEDHFSLAQLPDIASAMDRILRLIGLPDGGHILPQQQAITRERLYQVHSQLASGDISAALLSLAGSGWPNRFASAYLATQANKEMSVLVNVMAAAGGEPRTVQNLTLIHNNESAWLLTDATKDRNQLLVYQVNAASFRRALEESYIAVVGQA